MSEAAGEVVQRCTLDSWREQPVFAGMRYHNTTVSLCWLAFHSRFDEQATLNATITHSATSIVTPIAKLTTLPAFANPMCIRPLGSMPTRLTSRNCAKATQATEPVSDYQVHPKPSPSRTACPRTRLRTCGHRLAFAILLSQCLPDAPTHTPATQPRPIPTHSLPRTRKNVTLACHPFPGPDPSNPTHDPRRPHVCTISPHQSAPIPQFRHPS